MRSLLLATGLALVTPSLLGAGCTERARGIEVEVALMPLPSPTFTTADGVTVTLASAQITVWSTALLRCETQTAASGWLVGAAHAHGESDPTRSGVPVITPLSSGAPTTLAALTPPPDAWCVLELELAPADADARGLAHSGMEGRTLDVRGTWRQGDGPPTAFRVLGASTELGELPLGPLRLDDADDRVRVELTLDPARWFEGVALTGADPAAASRRLSSQLLPSLSMHTTPASP